MENRIDNTFRLLMVLGLLILFIALAAFGLWWAGYELLAGIVIGVVAGLTLLLIILVTSQITRNQTIATIQKGASIALEAQHINDAWDTKKTQVLGSVLRDGVRIARSLPDNDLPALPMPSQSQDWLPSLTSLEADFTEIED